MDKIISENGFLVENATERYIHFKKLYPDLSERVPQRDLVLIISASDTLQEWILYIPVNLSFRGQPI